MELVIPGGGPGAAIGPESCLAPRLGTPYPYLSGAGAAVRTALAAALPGHYVQIETQGEVFLKFGTVAVTAALGDYHLHIRGGDHRTPVFIPVAVTHISAFGIGTAYTVEIWRTDGT